MELFNVYVQKLGQCQLYRRTIIWFKMRRRKGLLSGEYASLIRTIDTNKRNRLGIYKSSNWFELCINVFSFALMVCNSWGAGLFALGRQLVLNPAPKGIINLVCCTNHPTCHIYIIILVSLSVCLSDLFSIHQLWHGKVRKVIETGRKGCN